MRVGVAPLPSKRFQQPLAGETGPWLGGLAWGLWAQAGGSCWHTWSVPVLPGSCLPKTAAGSSCWAQLAPRAGGHLLGIPGTAGSIPKPERQREEETLQFLALPCSLWGWAVSISTHHQGSAVFPAPFLGKKREKGDSASLQAQLWQQEPNVGDVCCVEDGAWI